MSDERPKRVRVTAPAMQRVDRPAFDLRGSSAGPNPASAPETVYVRSLIRSQLRLGLIACGGFLVATVALILIVTLVPALGQASVFGVPASWLLLGFAVYPLVVTVAVLYLRAAARNEARYRSLTEDE